MSTYKNLLAALAVGVVACHAQATTQAQVTLSNLSYQLKDLTPNDGLAPALTFAAGLAAGEATVFEVDQAGWRVTQQNSSWPIYEPLQKPSLSAANWQVGATAFATLASGFSSVQLTESGFEQLAVSAVVDAGRFSSVQGGYSHAFTLAAGTEVTFKVLVNGFLSGVGNLNEVPGIVFAPHSAASLSASMRIDNYNVESTLSREGQSKFTSLYDDFEQSIVGQQLTLTVKNTSLNNRTYRLNIGSSISVGEFTAPIPEPSTYALMALGLLGVGAATRRQRRG